MSFLEKFYNNTGSIIDKLSEKTAPLSHRLLDRFFPKESDAHRRSWGEDADWAYLHEQPLRARMILRGVLVLIIVLVLWASFASVDEVTRGEGKVIPSSQLQVMQSIDGGMVEEIRVKVGQAVNKGDILLRVDPTRFNSSLGENNAEALSLKAKSERLKALSEGRDFQPTDELTKAIPDIVAREQTLFYSSRDELNAQISIARQQLTQRTQELAETRERQAQSAQAYELSKRELDVTRPLAKTGAVSEVELLRLERDAGRYRSEREQAGSQILRLRSAMDEASRRIKEVELTFNNQVRNELSETLSKLSSLSASSLGLVDRVKHAEIRSPVRGTVKRLLVNTVGGVVQPGKDVIEIVPLDDVLLLEAKIQPKDIGFLKPHAKAMVKFTAYDFSIYGGLEAVVDGIGADTVTDDKGNSFYIVRVRTLKNSLGANLPIIPGMVAQVDIMTGKKTVLAYLLKPVLRAHANALSER